MLAFFGNLGTTELLILGIIALLIFGKRLPEVGRSLGKGIVEFKKGLAGVQDDLDRAGSTPSSDSTNKTVASNDHATGRDVR